VMEEVEVMAEEEDAEGEEVMMVAAVVWQEEELQRMPVKWATKTPRAPLVISERRSQRDAENTRNLVIPSDLELERGDVLLRRI